MNARVNHEDLFTAQVRALQAIYGPAHQALLNWAAWAHDLGKHPTALAAPAVWDLAPRSQWGDWADEQEKVEHSDAGKAEAAEKEEYDERLAEATNKTLHPGNDSFPAVYRRVIRIAYYWRIPEYQLPTQCRMDHDNFLRFLEGALQSVNGNL